MNRVSKQQKFISIFGVLCLLVISTSYAEAKRPNILLVIDGIFGQANDRIGVGYTWSDPANHELDNQKQIDSYYRVQVTPEIQVGPTFQLIFDPVRNPEEDTVYVWGIRSRIEF